MISVRGRDRTRRLLFLGLVLSLLIHLVGGSLFGLLSRAINRTIPQGRLRAPDVTKADIIHLEKAPPPPVARRRPPPPPPAPILAPRPIPAPRLVLPELFHESRRAPHMPAPSRGTGALAEPHVVSPAAGPSAAPKRYYSDEQLAQMNATFAQTIATHQTLAQVNAAMQTAPVVTTKHFEMHYNGIHEGLNPGDGIIEPTKVERRGNTMWYYTHYIYMYGDGHVEEDDIPWPFHYPVNDDPFARGDRRIPLQPPPADYKPDRPLKPQLMQFFGGPSVS